MNIIGLGKAGCNIADTFAKYPQYKIYKIDVGLEGKSCFNVKEQKGPEEYETNTPSFKTFFRGLKGESLFVVGGAGDISGMCLRILEQIRDKSKVVVLYIKPDIFMLNQAKTKHEKVTYNVLQHYARSAAVNAVLLISNPQLESILGEVPIIGYHNRLNELLVSTVHMINVFKNSEPVMGGLTSISEESTRRIYTVGIFDIEKGEEKLFFPLDKVRNRGYIYSISKGKLQTENDLRKVIRDQMEEKSQDKNVKISFGIFPTDYDNDYGYLLAHSPNIQS
tara:strand:+ start:5909 stop:6745 length:837 start_codon:yes stop_codon:yes gene_type:complete